MTHLLMLKSTGYFNTMKQNKSVKLELGAFVKNLEINFDYFKL